MSTTPPARPQADLDDFVKLSAALTGIQANTLSPLFDPHDLATNYAKFVTADAAWANLLAAYRANATKPPDDIAKALIQNADQNVSLLAQSVMLLWLLAAWFDPKDLKGSTGLDFTPAHIVVSADAYTQGFVWSIAQTKPMGYSEWEFGYWAKPPLPLSDFVGEAQK
jgi:hypothetical protein